MLILKIFIYKLNQRLFNNTPWMQEYKGTVSIIIYKS